MATTTPSASGSPTAQSFEAPISALSNTAVNSSTAAGTVVLTLNGNTLTADASLVGLVPDRNTPLAITALPSGSHGTLPPADQAVDVGSSQSPLGSVVLDLAANAQTVIAEGPGPHPDAMFAPADDNGNLTFHQTYTFDPSNPAELATLQALQSLSNHAVVVLGGINGTPGAPVIDPNLVVGAGLLQPVSTGSSAEAHGAATTMLG